MALSLPTAEATGTTRDSPYWPAAGCAWAKSSERPTRGPGRGRPYTPQNVLATIYHVLGIDPAMTFPDYEGRPVHLLDDREKIRELV